MNSKVIYIVEGASGEYSDHQEWQIAAYADEAEARKHAENAGAYARETQQMYDSAGGDFDRENEILTARNRANPYDRRFSRDDFPAPPGDVRYTAYWVPIRERAPTTDDPMMEETKR